MADYRTRPPRLSIVNLSTGAELQAQFNPTELKETLAANYTEKPQPGMSHPQLQFANTGAETFVFELFFSASGVDSGLLLRRARLFLKSLLVPVGGAEDVAGGAPPRALVLWPGMLSLQCVLRGVEMTHDHFNALAQSSSFTAAVTFAEVRDVRITSEDVATDRLFRYGDPDLQGLLPQ